LVYRRADLAFVKLGQHGWSW